MLGQAQIPEMLRRNKMHFEIRCNKEDATISLYADGRFALLIVLQGRDAAGKDAPVDACPFEISAAHDTDHFAVAEIDAGLLGEGQGETIALTADGRAFYTVPEGARPALRRYESSGGVS